MIRAVVFDWGGVIQRTEDPGPRRELERVLGLSSGDIDRAVFHSSVFDRAMLGLVGAEECWSTIAAAVGWPSGQVDEFVERFFAGDRLDPVLLRLIRWLRAQRLRVGLLSNAPPFRLSPRVAARWGMESLFDVQVFSYQVGLLKPDPRIYQVILEALQVPAQESLFIDDSPPNVAAALALGMEAIHFEGTERLLQDLAMHGLPMPSHKELDGG